MSNKKTTVPVFVDVEANGPSPVTHSLIQIGARALTGEGFKADLKPRDGAKVNPAALKAIGLTHEETMEYPDHGLGMFNFNSWLVTTFTIRGIRPVFWSDNPAFDWQFINGYFSLHEYKNPFGFSARRIGDLYAGLNKDINNSNSWKKLRKTKHTHDALDDATGNMEAFAAIKERFNLP